MQKLSTANTLKYLLIVLASVEVINLLTGRWLTALGIYPRELAGLIGVVAAPFIHGSLGHFFANIIPLCVFTFLLMQFNRERYFQITVFLVVTTGLLVWILARSSFHVGASGLIYGYFSYLLVAGFYSKRFVPTLASIFIGLFYGGMIFGVLPLHSYISWESHLFGFIMGLIATRVFPLHQTSTS